MTTQPIEPTIYQKYTEITNLMITSYSADKLDDLVEDYGRGNVEQALEAAKRNNAAHSWNYITTILRNWKLENKIVIERHGSDYASWND